MADRKLCVCESCHKWFSVDMALTPKRCADCGGTVRTVSIDYNKYSSWDEETRKRFRTEYEGSLPSYTSAPKSKGKVCCAFGSVLTVLYAFYIVSYFGSNALDDIGTFLASIIVAPHMVCVVIAAIFSLVGLLAYKRWAVLTAAILMAVAAALFPRYAMFVIVQSLLLFIAYARMLTPKKPA